MLAVVNCAFELMNCEMVGCVFGMKMMDRGWLSALTVELQVSADSEDL